MQFKARSKPSAGAHHFKAHVACSYSKPTAMQSPERCNVRSNAEPAPACRTPVRQPRNSNPSYRGIPIHGAETGRGMTSQHDPRGRGRAAGRLPRTDRARTPSQPARHTRRRQAQLIGSLRPWDGYPAAPSPPRLPPDGASTSLPVYLGKLRCYLNSSPRRAERGAALITN